MPSLPSHCYKTSHGFVFRLVVPKALRPKFGRREIKRSLGKDYYQAADQARQLSLQFHRQFDVLRAQQAEFRKPEDALQAHLELPIKLRPVKTITRITPEIVDGLASLWLLSLDADLSWREEGINDDDYDALQQNIIQLKETIANALARGQVDPFIPAIRGLLAGRGYQLAITAEEERRLILDILPIFQESYDILEQRQAGRRPERPKPLAKPLPAVWESTPQLPAPVGLSWQQLQTHWGEDRPRPLKTVKEVETYIAALSAYFPREMPATLTRAQVTEWLRHQRETRGNSAKTLEKKGTLVGAVFSIAVKDDLLERNPFANFDYKRFAMKQGIEDLNVRDPFTLEQLKRIFSVQGLFGISKRMGGGGYHTRVWMPLLALYTGARLDEIGSLQLSDIQHAPLPYLCIRKGKTQSSVREIPLHPKLIELGFLDYVEGLRRAGHNTLWPMLRTKSAVANPSEVLGRWFNRYIHESLEMPATVVFHSFRHTFKDLARNALIPREISHAITGHINKDKEAKEGAVGDNYGKGYTLSVKLEQMKKIVLDIDFPTPKP